MYTVAGKDYPYFTKSAAKGMAAVEAYSLENQKNRLKSISGLDLKEHFKQTLKDVPNMLPFAAEVYNISPNLKDYILTPVVSLPSDLPNLNAQAFPLQELTRWVPSHHMCMYRTWTGSPAFQDHVHDDHTRAKGIILSSVMRQMPNTSGELWKVVMLVAWDRNRDPLLANEILSKKRSHYSIGAYTGDYSCAICGHRYTAGEDSGWCEHVDDTPTMKVFDSKLAYWNVVDAVGFEISCVTIGAFGSTWDTPYFLYDDDAMKG